MSRKAGFVLPCVCFRGEHTNINATLFVSAKFTGERTGGSWLKRLPWRWGLEGHAAGVPPYPQLYLGCKGEKKRVLTLGG